jgi:hypothetical protein
MKMDVRIAERLYALFARKTGKEAVAANIVASLMERLSSSRSESSCELHAPSNHGPLGCPSPGMREGSPFGSSNPLLNGMKSGGKDSRELDFEKFIDSVGAPAIAQASEPLNSANRALINLTAAFQSMPPELRQEYGKPFPFEDSLPPYAYLRNLQRVGSNLLSGMEERKEPIHNRDQIIGITGEIRELFAEPIASPGRLLELVTKLHNALSATAGVDDIFSP